MEKQRSAPAVAPQTFEAQYDALLDAYFSLDASVEVGPGPATGVGRAQRLLELQSQMAQLSASQGELRRALDHYETIHKWIDNYHDKETEERKASGEVAQQPAEEISETVTEQPQSPPQDGDAVAGAGPPSSTKAKEDEEVPLRLRAVLVELKVNALANMSTIHFRLGDAKTAMTHLLRAKQELRALRVHSAIDVQSESPEAAELEDRSESLRLLETALAANYAVLLQATGASDDAAAAAEAALRLAGPGTNAKTARLEDVTVATAQLATEVLVSCARAKGESDRVRDLSAHCAHGLDTVGLSDPPSLARSHNNVALQYFENRDFDAALRHFLTAFQTTRNSRSSSANPPDETLRATLRYHIGRTLAELGTTVSLPGDAGAHAAEQVDARQCLTQLENVPDPLVRLLARASLAELAYLDGEFAAAETTLTSALAEFKQLRASSTQLPTPLASNQELVKIQGYMESCLGNALLAAGRYALAEEAHQRDLELALDSEELHAQLRALRNLALVYTATQRFAEAATLWRETLEIATVLASKRDQMVAYGALGAALHALSITEFATGASSELLSEPENEPRSLFLKQRGLATEIGDLEAQARAQRQIVGTYEWQPRVDELEKRLDACDAFVRLSEQLGTEPALCADAYRALANAINAQVKRLAARGARFAEAIAVLRFKRNAVLQKLRAASATGVGPAKPKRQLLSHVDVVERPFV